jgi:hypothetical protein
MIEKYLEAPLSMSMPAKPTSPDEINTIIKKIPAKKSPSHDLKTNYIVKNLPRKALVYLSHFYNAILRLSLFPNTWKHSVVILILNLNKPPENPASYRPISLLPTFLKIFEKILLKRLIPLTTAANIIRDDSSHTFNLVSEPITRLSTNFITLSTKSPMH